MEREWKAGDRFTLEGIVVQPAWNASGYVAFIGDAANTMVSSSAMSHAKLIQPAVPEPQKLDVTKPMRVVADSVPSITYVAFDPVMNMIYVRYPNGRIDCYPPEELENIPEPKRTTTQIVELVNFEFGPRIMLKSDGAFYVNVTSRAKVSHTEGEGWGIEEVAL